MLAALVTHQVKTNTIFIEIGSNQVLLLDHTHHINITIFQISTIHENTINNYDLGFIPNGTSNEYGLQSVFNGKRFYWSGS